MLAGLWWFLDHFSPHELRTKQKKTKNVVKVGPLLAKLSGSTHENKTKMIFNYVYIIKLQVKVSEYKGIRGLKILNFD